MCYTIVNESPPHQDKDRGMTIQVQLILIMKGRMPNCVQGHSSINMLCERPDANEVIMV